MVDPHVPCDPPQTARQPHALYRRKFSVQNELVPALVRRQFRNDNTGGEPLVKRMNTVGGEISREEAMVARMSR